MTDPVQGSDKPAYHAQFSLSPQFKKFWGDLFKSSGYSPTDDDMKKMTDQFIRTVWDQCDHVLKHALQVQKDLEDERKRDEQS